MLFTVFTNFNNKASLVLQSSAGRENIPPTTVFALVRNVLLIHSKRMNK